MDLNQTAGVPVIDLAAPRLQVSQLILKACEEFGFFMVVNHGVPEKIIARMEAVGSDFFSLPESEKQRSGPPNPLGYGFRTIGSNGDTGEVEYLLLHASQTYISLRAKTICKKDHLGFRYTNAFPMVGSYSFLISAMICKVIIVLSICFFMLAGRIFALVWYFTFSCLEAKFSLLCMNICTCSYGCEPLCTLRKRTKLGCFCLQVSKSSLIWVHRTISRLFTRNQSVTLHITMQISCNLMSLNKV